MVKFTHLEYWHSFRPPHRHSLYVSAKEVASLVDARFDERRSETASELVMKDGRKFLVEGHAVYLAASLEPIEPGIIACRFCERPATCYGTYEGSTGFACNDCCGHGREDGWCDPVAEYIEKLQADAERYRRMRQAAIQDRVADTADEFDRLCDEAMEKRSQPKTSVV